MRSGPSTPTEQGLADELIRLRMPRALEHAGGLLGSHYAILSLLVDESVEHSMSKVADLLGVTLSTASRQVNHANSLGLLTQVSMLRDRRVKTLVATEVGREQLESAQRERWSILAEVTADWPEPDVAELTRLVGQLNTEAARSRR